MAYVVADPCIGTKDRACVEVCPVSCFYENEDQLFIHPQECIDCDACVPVCPVTAIFAEAQVPEQWKYYIQKGIDYFAENTGVPAAKSKAEVGSGGVAAGSTHWKWKGQPAETAKAPAAAAAATAKVEAAPEPAAAPAHATSSAVAEAPPAPPPPKPPTPAPATVHATADTVAEAAAAPAPPKPAPTAPAAPAAAAPPAKPAPAAKPAAPPPKPMDPAEYQRLQALLYQMLEMLGGSRPFDLAVFAEAEATGTRLKKEVAVEFGKEVFTVSELEKKGMTLRQKQDLAQSLLQAADRAQFISRYRVKRQKLMQTAAGGAVTGFISVLCGVLSLKTVRLDAFFTDPNPSLFELLGSSLNQESLIPFLGFQMIAGLLGLFTLFAIFQCYKVGSQVHELKRSMQVKHIDPRLVVDLA